MVTIIASVNMFGQFYLITGLRWRRLRLFTIQWPGALARPPWVRK
jgi:hypothetical protein